MLARGARELSSVGQFMSRGSTLERATAFTSTAVANDRNAPAICQRELLHSKDHPVQEMQFYNIGGAKVFYYYGLDVVRSCEHVMGAGPHVRDTAVGVLMLDEYKIQERPGDPSNPLTFWPYQTFSVIPQGITFQKCRDVGKHGSNALRDFPLETSAICQALLALAEVASRRGYKRLMIVGDCGYYALAAEAFARNLSCWGNQSWVPHPDCVFTSFRCPRFRSPSLDLDIILCLGTTQMISSPAPEKNLSTQIGDDTSVVYLTADLRSFYVGEAHERVSAEYEQFFHRPWVTPKWHFNLDDDISMLDVVARVNGSILQAAGIKNNEDKLFEVVDTLLETTSGSAAYLVGIFLADAASQLKDYGETPVEKAWHGTLHLTNLVQGMAQSDDGTPHPEDIILEKVSPVFEYLEDFIQRISHVIMGKLIGILTEKEQFHMYAVLFGNPLPTGNPPPTTFKEFKLAAALRIQDTLLSLLAVGDLFDEISGLPIGKNYAEMLALYQAHLNKYVLSKVEANHAIDGSKIPLFDCRFVPGFGFNVNRSLTVWTSMSNYFWISTVLLRFSEIMQEKGWMGAVTYHLECTELFSFTPFFHEMGLPVVDGVNGVLIASRSTDAPMRFVNFKQENHEPPTPSAMVADLPEDSDVSYYRDLSLPLRTTTQDGEVYNNSLGACGTLMAADAVRWKKILLAQPLFDGFKLNWGFESYIISEPGDSIYPAASALDIPEYFEQGELDNPSQILEEDFVQYAQAKIEDSSMDPNFRSFFGGDIYQDQRRGRKSVAVKYMQSDKRGMGSC